MKEKILDSINLFPHDISFKYKEKSRFFSYYGLMLSVLSYGMIISLSYYFSYDLINRTNPKLKTTESELEFNDTINIFDVIDSFQLELKINFNLINENINPEEVFDEKIYIYLEIYNKLQKNSIMYYYGNFSNTLSNLSDSSEYKFSTNFYMTITNQTKLEKFNINNTKDIGSLNELNFQIKSTELIVYFEIQKPENVTDMIMKKSYFTPSIVDNLINIDQYNSYKIKSKKTFSNKIQSYFHVKYDYIQMNTDYSPFISYYEKDKFPQMNFYYYTFNEIILSSDYINEKLLNIEFREKFIFTRTYKKIWDVLSELGGIFNPILILGKSLIFSLNDKKYKLSILNDLFTKDDISSRIHKKTNIIDEIEIDRRKNKSIKKKPYFFKGNFVELLEKNKYNMNLSKDRFGNQKEVKHVNKKINFVKENSSFDTSLMGNFEEKNVNKVRFMKNIDSFSKNHLLKSDKSRDNKEIQFNILKDESIFTNKDSSNLNILNGLNVSKDEKTFIVQNDENIKKEIKEFYDGKKNKKLLLLYNSKDILISLFCSKNKFNKELEKKENLFDKILKRLNYYLDITNIMILYENLEKMKFILFNKYQIHCFDYMIHNINFNYDIRKEEESLYELRKYFEKLNKNLKEKNVDNRIKKIIKNEIKDLILKN